MLLRAISRASVLLAVVAAVAAVPVAATEPPADTLLADLGCPACHVSLGVTTDIRTKAPPLDDAGARYRPAYLLEYLRAPRAVRPHLGAARMPDFHLDEDEVLALTLFLSERKGAPAEATDLPWDLDVPVDLAARIGTEEEFRSRTGGDRLSCLVCHSLDGSGGRLGPELVDAGARLQTEWMRRFLAEPSRWGVPDGVMPALFLRRTRGGSLEPVDEDSVLDLRRLVDFLERTSESERARMDLALAEARRRHPGVTAADGLRLFRALGCAGCHVSDSEAPVEPAPDLTHERDRVRPTWLRSYLAHPVPIRPFGTRPGSGGRMPDFRLTADEVDRLATRFDEATISTEPEDEATISTEPEDEATISTEPGAPRPLTAYEREKARRLLSERLACRGCHVVDGTGGRIGPSLDDAAERLRPSFVRAMIDDPARVVPHATMPRLPLDEATRDLVVRFVIEPREAPGESYLSLITHRTIDLPAAPGAARDYARYCAPCHGAGGRGDGYNARWLPTPPMVHADAEAMALRADDTLYDGISAGGRVLDRSPLMPAWGETLAPDRVADLVRYLRELCRCEGPYWATDRAPRGEDRRAPRVPPRVETRSPTQAPPTFDDFVGAQACAPCHREEYARWRRSTHGHAGGVPGEADLVAAFDGRPRRFRDGVVRPVRTQDGRLVFRVRRKGRPEQEIEVAAIIGGGHMLGGGTQTFFTKSDDGALRMLPFDYHRGQATWFVQRRRDGHWMPISPKVGFDELEHWPPHRALGDAPHLTNCENCHGSQISVEFDEASGRYRTRWKSLAIDCESCHGPGREHVQWAHSADRDQQADIRIDPLAVQDKVESVEVCLRCHANKQIVAHGYLPGADPVAYLAFKLPMLAQTGYRIDGRIDGFGYQQNHLFSDCFVEGSMVCTDCHDPHAQTYRDVDGRALEGRFDDAQCTGCHAAKANDPRAHTHHAQGSPGNRCTACHMPYLQHQAVGSELRFARSDHTIAIPRPAFDESIGIENACAGCHPERSTAELQAEVDETWGPIKPHHPMIARLLQARDVAEPARAADLLLVPGEAHTIAQMAGLATFVREHVRTDTPLPDDALARLVDLAGSGDPDVAAVAITALDVSARADSRAAAVVRTARSDPGTRGEGLRRRWRWVLVDLSRWQDRRGDRDEAQRLRARLRELVQSTPAASIRSGEPSDAPG